MNIETSAQEQQHEQLLRQALRELPQEAAPPQLWSAIASRLQATPVEQLAATRPARAPVWRRRSPWLALAAGIAAAVLGAALLLNPPAPPAAARDATLLALQEQSRELEQRLSSLRSNDTRYSARAARLEQSLADGLALTDLQLSAASEPQITKELWQRRVALLSTWLDLNAMGTELGDNRSTTEHANEEEWL